MNQNFAQKILSKSEFCTKIISDATFDRMDPLFLKNVGRILSELEPQREDP
jgi:hypothetical protein